MPTRNGNGQPESGQPATPSKPRRASQNDQVASTTTPASTGAGAGSSSPISRVGRAISQNPIPVGMIWIGAGWLALRQLSSGGGASSGATSTVKETAGTAGETVGQAMSATQDAVGRLLGGAQHFVATVGEQAPRAAEQVAGTAGTQAARARSALRGVLEERPVAVAAAAAAGGAALGLVAPTTRKEAEVLAGPASGLVTRAESVATDTIDTLEQMVGSSAADQPAGSTSRTRPRRPANAG